jgi:hypothetical protein
MFALVVTSTPSLTGNVIPCSGCSCLWHIPLCVLMVILHLYLPSGTRFPEVSQGAHCTSAQYITEGMSFEMKGSLKLLFFICPQKVGRLSECRMLSQI